MTAIALGQIRAEVGDLAGNAERMLACARRSVAQGAALIAFPELSLTGYPPEDLLLRGDFVAAAHAQLNALADAAPDGDMLVGLPWRDDGRLYNAVAWIHERRVAAVYRKRLLPNYGVFDERRYFTPGEAVLVRELAGLRIGVTICEDLWEPGPACAAAAAGAQVLVNVNASPYHRAKDEERFAIARARIAQSGIALAYVNMVGAQDELVFDGASFVLDRTGALAARAGVFEEDLLTVSFDDDGNPAAGPQRPWPEGHAALYEALRLGLRDYVARNRFERVILGLSGGIDSAVTLALACDALTPDTVQAVMMPSRFTSPMSIADATAEARALSVALAHVPIEDIHETFARALAPHWQGPGRAVAEENLQARIRGTLLMSLANAARGLVLVTSNKSELAVGYTTLYGDMAGGYAPLKDVLKTDVYALARYRNARAPVIPERVLARAPSAELRLDQKDSDSLPPYEVLDPLLAAFVEEGRGPRDLIADGYPRDVVMRVVGLVRAAEHKRRQAPLGTRVSARAFGRDWRYPVSVRYEPEERERDAAPGHRDSSENS